MFKVGDYVTRKKYNNDILFRIDKIENNKIILSGVDLRLYAECNKDDLVLSSIRKDAEDYSLIRKLDDSNYFYLPGIILHIDSDKNYLEKCLNYYKKHKLKCYSYIYNESEYPNIIEKLIKKHNPDIVVITGHDAYYKKDDKYKNSIYFEECVKKAISINNDLIIISGACQSDFISLIKAGSSYASSPSHINIHALDPAIIATYIALSDRDKEIDLKEILSKTKYGSDGIGGIKTNGVMKIGTPRKDKN